MLIIYSERNSHNLFPNNYDNYGNFCPFFEKFLTIMRISFHFLQFPISFRFFSIHDTIPFPSIPDFFPFPSIPDFFQVPLQCKSLFKNDN